MSKSSVCLVQHAKQIDHKRIKAEADALIADIPRMSRESAMMKVANGILADLKTQERSLLNSNDGVLASKTNPSTIYPTAAKWSGGDTILIDGKPRSTINSDGKPIAQTEEGLRNFYQWFKNSAVVDDKGNPLVVYHGSKNKFNAFEAGRKTKNYAFGSYEAERLGLFFTSDKNFAKLFKDDNGQLFSTYLSIQKEADLTEGFDNDIYTKTEDVLRENHLTRMNPEEMWELFDKGTPGAIGFVSAMQNEGYDGAQIIELDDDSNAVDVFVAFNPNQIKSTSNTGSFNPENNDIRYSFAGEKANTADQFALSLAQERLANGEDAETVRQDTGWHRGVESGKLLPMTGIWPKFFNKSSVPQRTINSVGVYSKLFSDLLISKTFKSQGLNGFDVPTNRMVLSTVISVLHDSEIRNRVIKLIPVDVVDMLIREKLTPKMLLNDMPMLLNLLSVDSNNSIPIGVDVASSITKTVADVATENSNALLRSGLSMETIPTVATDEIGHFFVFPGAFDGTKESSSLASLDSSRADMEGFATLMAINDRHTDTSENVFDKDIISKNVKNSELNRSVHTIWKFEISDREAKTQPNFLKGDTIGQVYNGAIDKLEKNGVRELFVGDVISHPKLFAAYPSLKTIPVYLQSGKGGGYHLKHDILLIGEDAKLADIKSIILHELQHAIQHREGFAAGGNPNSFKVADFATQLSKAYQDFIKEHPEIGALEPVVKKMGINSQEYKDYKLKMKELGWAKKQAELSGFDKYQRLAGEVEARNTQARALMSDEYRKMIPPGETADVKDADVIVDWNGKEVAGMVGEDNPIQDENELTEPSNLKFSRRTEAPPTKTIKAYKLFRIKKNQPGKLFPLFVKMENDKPVPIGVWEDAEIGEQTDKGKVKSKLGPLAFRPGWHMGEAPGSFHIGGGLDANHKPTTRPSDQVWAEVDVSADIDWQEEADRRASINKKGEIIANTAHLTDRLPTNGFYKYKTNANMVGKWIIAGSMKVNRVLSDDEVYQINERLGARHDLPRETPLDLNSLGFDPSSNDIRYSKADTTQKDRLAPNGKPSKLNALQYRQVRTPEFKAWFGDWENDPDNASKVVDDNGEPRVFYHGTMMGKFNSFDMNYGWSSRTGAKGTVSLTSNKNFADERGSRTIEGFLAIRNPFDFRKESDIRKASQYLRDVYEDMGYSRNNLVVEDKIETLKKGDYRTIEKEIPITWYKENGYDGHYMLESIGHKDLNVNIFSPNQIKSATGNNGKFDASNNDIRFSVANNTPSTTEINSAIREYLEPRKGKQPLGWLAGIFQRNHLIDFAVKELPMLEAYKTLSQEKDNVINQAEHEIAESYQTMKDSMTSAEMNELGRVQGMATRLKDFDPEQFDGDVADLTADEKNVLAEFRSLSESAKKAYVKMREDYTEDLMAKKQALINRINEFPIDPVTRGEIIRQIEAHFDQHIKKGVYFPLSRNGNIVITAEKHDEHGNNLPDERIVAFVEDGKAKDKLLAELKAQGYKNRKSTLKDIYIKSLADNNAANKIAALATKAIAGLSTNLQQQDADAVPDFAGFNARDIIEGGNYNDLLDEFNQLLIEALPDSSYRKHFIHRKGTLGYSTDTLRAYAGTRSAAAKNIAGLKFNHKITGQLTDAGKAIKAMDDGVDSDTDTGALKSVLNELQLREETLKNASISPVSQTLTSLGFMGALGFNVASAAVNMLQVPGVTFPELAGKYGVKVAFSEINKAYGLLFNKNVLDKQSGFDLLKHPAMLKIENSALKQALQQLNDIGKIDLTMTHDAISMGQNPSYSDNAITRTVGGVAKYSGYLFHVAEALNRQVTGIAAFNLAYKQNGGNYEEALKSAIDAIDRTQFDYSQGNRARHMMGDTARVLTLFKSYALGISYYMGRNVHNALKGETPEIRLAARKTLVTQMAMTFATSGLFGLPIGMEAFAALGGVAGFKYKGANFAVPGAIGGMLIFQALLAGLGADDEDELETEFRNWLTDNFDQTTAEWVTKGPARLLPIGDIAGRTGLADIWWRPQNKELEGKDQYQAFANALLGPLGSQAAGLFTATKMYQDGEYARMIESMSPAFIRNAVAAARMGNEGAKTIKGDPLIARDLTATELINKTLGFNPTALTNNYDANTAITRERDKISMKKAHLVNRYISSDSAGRVELMNSDIKDFNASVAPSERITIPKLMKSIRQRRSLDKRTENGLYLSKKQDYLRSIGRFAEEE